MSKYRKKPVVVDAHQWYLNGDHPHDDIEMIECPGTRDAQYQSEGKVVRRYRIPGMDGEAVCPKCGFVMENHGWIDTLEGGHIVCVGDWIITGVQGEHYPCKPDIFKKTYEAVSD